MGDWSANNTFNPYTQPFLLVAPDGTTPVTAFMSQLLSLQYLATTQGIIFGVQTGLTGLLFVILVLMTKRDKRRSMVYTLNVTALGLLFIRGVLACVELNTIIYNYYNWQLHWYPDGPALRKSQGVSTATEVLNWFVDAAIYGSLVLQVHIVCCTLRRTYKLAVLSVCGIVSLVALGVRLYLAVYNIKYVIIGLQTTTYAEQIRFNYIGSVDNIVSVTTIAIFSAIFVTKLGFAIHLRRKLNMKQFGPMQIIFVMGCQTLCIPLIFAIITYYTLIGAQINSMVPTVVAIFLPLSGMWASVQTNQSRLVRSNDHNHRAIPLGATQLSNSKGYNSRMGKSTANTSDTADTLIGGNSKDDLEMGYGADMIGRASSGHTRGAGANSADESLEIHELKNDIVVDRTYSVRSD